MDQKIKRKWVKALRSGRYKQVDGTLYNGKAYCCLGVLCRIVGAKRNDGLFVWGDDGEEHELPDSLRRELRIRPNTEKKLIKLNDGYLSNAGRPFPPKSFAEIAAYIEKNL